MLLGSSWCKNKAPVSWGEGCRPPDSSFSWGCRPPTHPAICWSSPHPPPTPENNGPVVQSDAGVGIGIGMGWGGWMRRNKTIKRHRKGIIFPKECRFFMIWSSHPFEKWRSFFIMYFHRRLLQPEAPSSRGDPRSNLEVLCHEAP